MAIHNFNNYITMNFLERKIVIDELEASLKGSIIDDTNIEMSVVDVEVNYDEYITSGAKASKINKPSCEMEIYL